MSKKTQKKSKIIEKNNKYDKKDVDLQSIVCYNVYIR